MNNRFRLSSSVFERETDEEKISPQKIYFLSVEGNHTEKEYFDGVSKYRQAIGIHGKIDVEILKRRNKDTNSAPQHVVELLEEYLRLRQLGEENLIQDIPESFIQRYGLKFIETYLNSPESIPRKLRNEFTTELMKMGYDINYRKYLNTYQNELDEFGILIDRDMQTHSEINIRECIEHCKSKGYNCYIANPCFEFWLLLHLSDVAEEYKDRMDDIKENKKISGHHTYVSKEVSMKAHHGKSGINFKENYLPFIDEAIKRAKQFAGSEEELIDEVGCNLWSLMEALKSF